MLFIALTLTLVLLVTLILILLIVQIPRSVAYYTHPYTGSTGYIYAD